MKKFKRGKFYKTRDGKGVAKCLEVAAEIPDIWLPNKHQSCIFLVSTYIGCAMVNLQNIRITYSNGRVSNEKDTDLDILSELAPRF